ncbi:hypothetical protein SAMN03159444_00109 [Pseudomonas sp. NFACC02]|uniref:hypothetical protein n=1 Tax=Pseudomonas sp. NFACC02 TaxID=1566250 RepID=UPI0008CAF342|nr:hypothetical protein [Pseudomonas sp. NFACC02]SEP57913.1 hypothetical protein SAMN03159444_00109 [Pseudomonas sp. NFACC02]
MTDNLARPSEGMIIRNKRSGTMYQIAVVESDRVYIKPYWPGRNARSTWKTLTRLWCDCYRVDDTAVTHG